MNVITSTPTLHFSLAQLLHRKLTLENLYWTVFESEAEREDNGRQFVQLMQEQLSKPATEVGHHPCVCVMGTVVAAFQVFQTGSREYIYGVTIGIEHVKGKP